MSFKCYWGPRIHTRHNLVDNIEEISIKIDAKKTKVINYQWNVMALNQFKLLAGPLAKSYNSHKWVSTKFWCYYIKLFYTKNLLNTIGDNAA